jgi:hypothetical protein
MPGKRQENGVVDGDEAKKELTGMDRIDKIKAG